MPMLNSWSGRSFCNSTHQHRETSPSPVEKQNSPSIPDLRCRTKITACISSSARRSPESQSKTTTPRKFFNLSFSNPSSPRPSTSFTFLKNSLGFYKSRCAICSKSVKRGPGTAIFTAECNHVFHFPCVVAQGKRDHQLLIRCPVCRISWKGVPFPSVYRTPEPKKENSDGLKVNDVITKTFKVYNDDEPLTSTPSCNSIFTPIPELEENEDQGSEDQGSEDQGSEYFGGFVDPAQPMKTINQTAVEKIKKIEFKLLPDAAVVADAKKHETHLVVLGIKAPPIDTSEYLRSPIDLVVVMDVSDRMLGEKSKSMKRVARSIIALLNSNDRLSIIVFSSTSKRLSPLRGMIADGKRSARRIVDSLRFGGDGMSASDALKKAAKVMEDRRQRNPFASVIVLSTCQMGRSYTFPFNPDRSFITTTTRFSIPVHSISFVRATAGDLRHAQPGLLRRLLTGSVRDLKIQLGVVSGSAPAEISAVYSLTDPPVSFEPDSVPLGDLHGEEERELLVELKVPGCSGRSNRVLTVRSVFRETFSGQQISPSEQALLLPRPCALPSSVPHIQRLKSAHVALRAAVESRRLIDCHDVSAAHRLLSSARASLVQWSDVSAEQHLCSLEAEVAELIRRQSHVPDGNTQDQPTEPPTPTSAWRAAERLAKLAIMKMHMNRVSDLHGFENARF